MGPVVLKKRRKKRRRKKLQLQLLMMLPQLKREARRKRRRRRPPSKLVQPIYTFIFSNLLNSNLYLKCFYIPSSCLIISFLGSNIFSHYKMLSFKLEFDIVIDTQLYVLKYSMFLFLKLNYTIIIWNIQKMKIKCNIPRQNNTDYISHVLYELRCCRELITINKDQ